jgi:putative ABC transport system permease protein
MLQNYLKIAFRNLLKNKRISAINIAGLAIGMATCLIIMLFVQHELSFDRYNEKADRMVRVVFQGMVGGERLNEAHVMPPVAQTLLAEFPEVQEATRLRQVGAPLITCEGKSLKNQDVAFVDVNFFEVFTLPLVQGDAKTALSQPNSVVISRAVAQKLFDNEDPIGKVLTFKGWDNPHKITGVIDRVPDNSHFHFDLFTSMAGMPEAQQPSWMVSEFYTYLVLPEGYDHKKLEAKLPMVLDKYLSPQLEQAMGMTLAAFRKTGNDLGLHLQPLTDIHLHSDFAFDLAPHGDVRYVYIFGAIAVFMLLIAGINFMNLSTAGASKRAREVGVRKVMGSKKGDLVQQFLLESILMAMAGLVLALALVDLALPLFNQLAGKNLDLQLTASPWLLPGLVLFGLFTGVLAGSYPAFFLSAFHPGAVLKGSTAFTGSGRSIGLRSGLVVFQFFLSITLMVSTAVVYRQLQFIQQAKLGYDKDAVLVLPDLWALGQNEAAFRQQIRQDPRVAGASYSGYLPAGASFNNNFFLYTGENQSQMVKTLRYDVDEQYIPTLGIQIAAGRNFLPEMTTDSSGIILNEAAVRAFGWTNDVIGQTLTHSDNQGVKKTYRVIGMVQDFHFKSLHERISPLVMVQGGNSGAAILKVKTTDVSGLLSDLKNRWATFTAEEPFTYAFLDERIYETYQSERKTGAILGIFAGLTIFVACLGLFGLAIFTAEQRTKEIGVRKVLGATAASVVQLLSKDFLKLVLIAYLVACPVAWWVMDQWLQDFAYRTSIGWDVFAAAGLAAMGIAFLTVSFQSVRAALANPVKSLRSE